MKYECEDCLDTGFVTVDYRNSDGNIENGTGTEKCKALVHYNEELYFHEE